MSEGTISPSAKKAADRIIFHAMPRPDQEGRIWSRRNGPILTIGRRWTPGDVMTRRSFDLFKEYDDTTKLRAYRFEPLGFNPNEWRGGYE